MATGKNICNEVLVELRRIIRAVDIHSRRLEKNYNITGPQLTLLQQLDPGKEVYVGEIAVNISLASATVTDICNRLENRGLVERIRSESDRRRVNIKITDAGIKLLESAPPLLQKNFTDKFQDLKEWEQTLLLSSIQRIVGMMSAEGLDASSVLATGDLTEDVHLYNTQKKSRKSRKATS